MAKKRPPSGPRLSSGSVVGWTPEKEAMAYNLEQKYGLPEGTIQGMSYRESQFGKLANRPGSQYQSEFQLGKAIRGKSGVTDTRDFQQTAEAAAKYAQENQAGLRAKLGREPTREELYMGHQQGLGGASKLISNPNASAASQIGQRFASANGGRGMSSQQFIDKHSRAFNEGIKQGDNQLWNSKSAPGIGDKTQLAMRGGEQPTVMAALEKLNQQQPQTMLAKAEPKAPDNLPAWAKTQMAQLNPNDMGKGIPASGMQTPPMNPQLQQPAPTQMAALGMNDFGSHIPTSNAPTPPMNPQLDAPPVQMAEAPVPPSRPDFATSNAPAPVQVASFNRPAPSTPRMPSMAAEQPLHAPMGGGGGGVEGMASGLSAPTQMAGDMGGEFSLASLFGDAMGPQQQEPFMMADAGFGDFGGGGFDAGGGFDLAGLFGGLFA